MKTQKKIKEVRVTWLDSMSGPNTWTLLESYSNKEYAPGVVTTLGFVIEENNDFIVVVQNIIENPKQFCNTMTIPKRSIIKKEELWKLVN